MRPVTVLLHQETEYNGKYMRRSLGFLLTVLFSRQWPRRTFPSRIEIKREKLQNGWPRWRVCSRHSPVVQSHFVWVTGSMGAGRLSIWAGRARWCLACLGSREVHRRDARRSRRTITLRARYLDERAFSSVAEAGRIIEAWRIDYNAVRLELPGSHTGDARNPAPQRSKTQPDLSQDWRENGTHVRVPPRSA